MIPILGRELPGNVRHYEKTKHTNNWHSERMRNTKQRQRTHFKNHRENSPNLKKKVVPFKVQEAQEMPTRHDIKEAPTKHNNQIKKKDCPFGKLDIQSFQLNHSFRTRFHHCIVCLCFVTFLINFVAVTSSPGITPGIYTKMLLWGKSWLLSFLRTMVGIISGVVIENTDVGNERHQC